MADMIMDVDLAKDVKDFVLGSDDITFDNAELKNKILGTPDDKLLRIGKTIDSPTRIMLVDLVDDMFDT